MSMTSQCIYVIIAIIPIMAAFSTSRAVEARTYYVATNGDDNQPGTEAQPLGTVQKAASRASPDRRVSLSC